MKHAPESAFAIGLLGTAILFAILLHGGPLAAAVGDSKDAVEELQFELPEEIPFEPSAARAPMRGVQYAALFDALDASVVEPIREVLRVIGTVAERVRSLIVQVRAILVSWPG